MNVIAPLFCSPGPAPGPAPGGGGEGSGDTARPEGPGGSPALPCLNSNICIMEGGKLTPAGARTAYALQQNVANLAAKFGLEKLGFLTLTFADKVVSMKEAQRRFHSLRTNVLRLRYREFLGVPERMKSGRIHFHLLVVLNEDIWTGFDWNAYVGASGFWDRWQASGKTDVSALGWHQRLTSDYARSANDHLRSEWAFWRKTARSYRFGRTELLPVRSTAEAISVYVGKYIAKHMFEREEWDKGYKLVLYSPGARTCTAKFGWNTRRAWLWRRKLEKLARDCQFRDMDDFTRSFGPRWAWGLAASIQAVKIDES